MKFSMWGFLLLALLTGSVGIERIARSGAHTEIISGCRDIDDALRCTLLPSGHFEVGVYIADVTNFVHPGTPLDDEAAKRGNSIYLVEQHIDMLPEPLTEGNDSQSRNYFYKIHKGHCQILFCIILC